MLAVSRPEPDHLVSVSTWKAEPGHEAGMEALGERLLDPLVLLSLVTYLMMPLVTRVLGGWLYPDGSRR